MGPVSVTLRGFSIIAFMVGAAYLPGILSAASMPRWWIIAIGIPLVSTLDPRNLLHSVAFCLLAGFVWAAVSLIDLPAPSDGALDLLMLALLCLTIIAAAGEDDIDSVITAFGWSIAISCLIAVPQWFGWSPVFQTSAPAGLFLNSEVLAEIAAPLLVWAAFKHRWALAVLMLVPLVLCHSRIAVLVAAAGLLAGWRPKQTWIKGLIFSAMMLAAILSVILFGAEKASSGMTRLVLWGAALQSIELFGQGIGWWALAHPDPFEEFAHSDLLQLMVELGVGALFFFAIPVLILSRRDAGNAAERAAFVAVCTEAIVSFPLHLATSGFLAAVLAGNLARDRNLVRACRLSVGNCILKTSRR